MMESLKQHRQHKVPSLLHLIPQTKHLALTIIYNIYLVCVSNAWIFSQIHVTLMNLHGDDPKTVRLRAIKELTSLKNGLTRFTLLLS